MKYKILIAIIVLAGLGIVAASVWIGVEKRDVQVEENPYDAGLQYDERLRRYAELGWKIEIPKEIRAGERWLAVGLFDRDGRPMKDAKMECLIATHGKADLMRTTCTHRGEGFYQCAVKPAASGYLNVRVNASRANDTMRFDNIVIVDK